jgi:hypothetical protein
VLGAAAVLAVFAGANVARSQGVESEQLPAV